MKYNHGLRDVLKDGRCFECIEMHFCPQTWISGRKTVATADPVWVVHHVWVVPYRHSFFPLYLLRGELHILRAAWRALSCERKLSLSSRRANQTLKTKLLRLLKFKTPAKSGVIFPSVWFLWSSWWHSKPRWHVRDCSSHTHNTWVFSAISYEQYIYMLLHFGLMWWSCKHKAASSSYTATFLTKLVNVNPVFTQFYPSFWSLWWWVLIWKHLPALRRMRVKLDTRYKCLQSWMELQTVAIMHDDLLNVKD